MTHPVPSLLPTILTLGMTLVIAVAAGAPHAEEVYAPHALEDFPMELYWGDTHVHSSFSMDANAVGNTRLSPAAAYRFAKGEAVVANSGMTAKLDEPLDFLVVSDHAEYMGLMPALRASDPRILDLPAGADLHRELTGGEGGGLRLIGRLIDSLMRNAPMIDNAEFKQSIWKEITGLADAANAPGQFTALIGFEWTSLPGGDNLHRVVVYGDDAARRDLEVAHAHLEAGQGRGTTIERKGAGGADLDALGLAGPLDRAQVRVTHRGRRLWRQDHMGRGGRGGENGDHGGAGGGMADHDNTPHIELPGMKRPTGLDLYPKLPVFFNTG